MQKQLKVLSGGLVVGAMALGLVGCGGGGGSSPSAPGPAKKTPMELLESDLNHFRSTEHTGFANFDNNKANPGLFTQTFGGTTTDAVRNYLETRVKYYFDHDPSEDIIQDGGLVPTFNSGMVQDDEPQARLGAVNMGFGYWLGAVISGAKLYLNKQGEMIPIDSSRVGIVRLGEAYDEETITFPDGVKMDLPPEYRESILIHEARHSDCTGGLKQSLINRIRMARTSEEVMPLITGMSCGHSHVKCPPGHPLQDLYACDNEDWGAYTIGAMYSAAVAMDTGLEKHARALANADFSDSQSRVLTVMARPRQNRVGSPDMTSAGVVNDVPAVASQQ